MDGAGFHQERSLIFPEAVIPFYLPPYSPELQPAERLWPLSNEAIANTHFTSLDTLETAQLARCNKLREQQEEVKKRCLFGWWPTIEKGQVKTK